MRIWLAGGRRRNGERPQEEPTPSASSLKSGEDSIPVFQQPAVCSVTARLSGRRHREDRAGMSVCSPPKSTSECLPFTGSRRRLCGFRRPRGDGQQPAGQGCVRPQPTHPAARGQPGPGAHPPGASSSQRGPGTTVPPPAQEPEAGVRLL